MNEKGLLLILARRQSTRSNITDGSIRRLPTKNTRVGPVCCKSHCFGELEKGLNGLRHLPTATIMNAYVVQERCLKQR